MSRICIAYRGTGHNEARRPHAAGLWLWDLDFAMQQSLNRTIRTVAGGVPMVAQLKQFFRVFAIEAAAAELAGADWDSEDDRTHPEPTGDADAVQPAPDINPSFH